MNEDSSNQIKIKSTDLLGRLTTRALGAKHNDTEQRQKRNILNKSKNKKENEDLNRNRVCGLLLLLLFIYYAKKAATYATYTEKLQIQIKKHIKSIQ